MSHPHPASEGVLSTPALGRPFLLGTLYDCRTDKIIDGVTLWDTETLKKKCVQRLETADFQVITSDSLDKKTWALDLKGRLKLSLFSGLLDISGSAKYLDNRISSSQQERVTLQYKCTTRSETLTMEQMGQGKVQHPHVFDHGTATHVVTGIVYGGQAFFVFDREHSSSSNNTEIDGTLHLLVKKIPMLPIDGEGQLNLSEDDKKRTENFNCKFFGDFLPRENPSTFIDAVRLYKEIPSLLGDSVPVKVTLYPLTLLDSKASKLVREISTNLISTTENIFENLHEIDVKCNDMYNSHAAKKFSAFQKEISSFKGLIATYKLEFQKKIATLLPRIRGGGTEESELAAVLTKNKSSPFSQQAVHAWIQGKEKQLKILTEYASALSEIKFVSQPGDLESTNLSLENDYTLCFAILIPKTNLHLEKMAKYIDVDYTNECISKGSNSDDSSMIEKARLFRKFFGANKDRKGTAFLVSEDFSNSEEFQAQVRCYKHGRLEAQDYALPSEPGMPEVDVKESTHDSVTIHWTTPTHGVSSDEKYEILCQEIGEDKNPIKFSSDSVKFTIANLHANCTYQVSVRSHCEAGLGPSSDTNPAVSTKPTSPPSKPKVSQISPTTVAIHWLKPKCIGSKCSIQKYIIEQQEENTNSWSDMGKTNSGDELTCTIKVTPNTTHKFRIRADCGTAGYSVASEPTDIFVKAEPIEVLKERVCAASKLLHVGHPSIYKPDLKLVFSRDNDMIQKYEFGVPHSTAEEKVIMLVGSTGSGKSTLINGLINYIFGVKWKDSFRFKLIVESTEHNQAKSQTKQITSYTIHHQEGFKVPCTLTIIDTPGFGDTSGVMRDREITEQIRKFFSTGGMCGVDHIDAVGFVVQSSLPRLTPTQTYIFDQILSLFGKDIKDNIFLLLTFADGQNPQVLSGIKEAGMPYRKHFKFNSSALFANNSLTDNNALQDDSDSDEGDSNFDEMFWHMGVKSYKVFLQQLNLAESKSLILTKDVLNERYQLQIYIKGIQEDIQRGLSTLERLQTEVQVLKTHQADIDKNKNFTYTVNEETFEKVPIPGGQYITNCLPCGRTCHVNCAIRDDDKKAGCWAMTNGYCRICPSKCIWSMHSNFPYKFVLKTMEVTKTAEELKQRYNEASEKKLTAETLITRVQDEFEAVQLKVLGMTESVRRSLERLQEIALKPNPLSTVEYIDIMIDSEQSQALPGWQARIQQLKNVRKETEYMQEIARKGFDPFIEYRKKIDLAKKSKFRKFWSEAGEYLKDIFT